MKFNSTLVCSIIAIGALSGCSELRARSTAREGNEQYRDGNYAAAAQKYEAAQQLHPDIPVILFNRGLACRQLMVPGAKTKESEQGVNCALDAFKRLQAVNPKDERAEQLYIQTLFDADRFETLAAMYEKRLQENPKDSSSINGLIQVYSRWNKPEEALRWTMRRADSIPSDAEAQYSVGVYIWNQLFMRGGGVDKQSFDPRPDPNNPKVLKIPPAFASTDVAGPERIKLADQAIQYLEKALTIRPSYKDAMVYLNLVYRQKAFAYFDQPQEWQKLIDTAETWRKKATEMDVPPNGAASASSATPNAPAASAAPAPAKSH
ncbi:MAG TPA: hypothetical protein VFQ61_07780 [Polyangiaceae bacterium]|nr:hypothetical protein [Polyangiaceae bacterium]